MHPLRPASRTAPPNLQKMTLKEWKVAPDPQEDVENVEGLPHAEPEKFAVGGAQEEEHQGAEARQQANKAIDVELRVDPKYRRAIAVPATPG